MFFLMAMAIFVHRFFIEQPLKTGYEVFVLPKGWGYRIIQNNKVFIQQEQIPAVQGYAFFQTKQDAENTAKLVTRKMKDHELPMVSIAELDSMGVVY